MPSPPTDFRQLRLAFAGTPDFAARHLRALLDAGADIAAVYTQPDRPSGRGKKLVPGPVKQLALEHGLDVHQPRTLKGAQEQAQLAALQVDVMVVVAYGLLVPPAVLALPRHGCINVHASLLPRWRGAAPIQRAIEAGDPETGVTIMQMAEGLDTGDILHMAHCPIDARETGGSLHDKLAALGPSALITTLDRIARGEAHPVPQDDSRACYAPKISKAEARLDWTRPAAALERQVRAFNPFPVAFFVLESETVRVWEASVGAGAGEPGTVLAVDDRGIEVACGEGSLLIREMQLSGKKRLPVADILRGHPRLVAPGRRLDADVAP